MSRSAPAPRRLREAEVVGFRAGVAHALSKRRGRGAPDLEGEADLAEADRSLARHDLVGAETLLVRAHARLAESAPEVEVAERPRGLVGFVADGPPDAPTPPEEDRLRNRLLILSRLATLPARSDPEVARALAALGQARLAIEQGDRVLARTLIDRATDELDRAHHRRTASPGAGAAARDG